MRGVLAFLVLWAILDISPSAAQEMTERQRDIYQTTLRVDGWLTEDMHKEFWAGVPQSVRSNVQAWTSTLEESAGSAWKFQVEIWKSARLSIIAKAPTKSANYESAKQECLRQMMKISSAPQFRAQLESGIRQADQLIVAAAAGNPLTVAHGSFYITEDLVESMLARLEGAHDRFVRLINPVWAAQPQTQKTGEKKFSNFEEIVRVVKSFDQADRKAIILMVRGFIKVNFKETLAEPLASPGLDGDWALRTVAISESLMMKLAYEAGWPEMGVYYETEVKNLTAYAEGRISGESYTQASKKNQGPLATALSGYDSDAFRVRMSKHKPLADSIGSYIVGTSKLASHKAQTKH